MTSVDQQQLQLLHQIQEHLLSNSQILILYLAMFLPIPVSWRLNLYQWLASLPLPSLSTNMIVLLFTIGPISLIICAYFSVKGVIGIFRTFIPFIFFIFRKKLSDRKLIQLIFPADTDKS
ncbi:MAG: hypothetical protein WCP39_07705, partial [Chlamydiota bacterium]